MKIILVGTHDPQIIVLADLFRQLGYTQIQQVDLQQPPSLTVYEDDLLIYADDLPSRQSPLVQRSLERQSQLTHRYHRPYTTSQRRGELGKICGLLSSPASVSHPVAIHISLSDQTVHIDPAYHAVCRSFCDFLITGKQKFLDYEMLDRVGIEMK